MSDLGRLLGAIQAMAREAFPRADFAFPYRYRVVEMSADRVQLQAVRRLAGLPDLLPGTMFPGVSGAWAALKPGSLVLVSFIEGDPSQPIVTHYATKDDPGWRPVRLELDAEDEVQIGEEADLVTLGAGSPPGVARVGDPIASSVSLLYAGPGTLTAVPNGTPGAIPITGTITGGSSKVKAE